jgi:hypothetical protein
LGRLAGLKRLVRISRQLHRLAWLLHRLAWKHWLTRLPRILRLTRKLRLTRILRLTRKLRLNWLLGLIGIRLPWRLFGAGIAARYTADDTTSPSTPSDDAVAWPAQRHVQWIGGLRVGIVGVHRLGRIRLGRIR